MATAPRTHAACGSVGASTTKRALGHQKAPRQLLCLSQTHQFLLRNHLRLVVHTTNALRAASMALVLMIPAMAMRGPGAATISGSHTPRSTLQIRTLLQFQFQLQLQARHALPSRLDSNQIPATLANSVSASVSTPARTMGSKVAAPVIHVRRTGAQTTSRAATILDTVGLSAHSRASARSDGR